MSASPLTTVDILRCADCSADWPAEHRGAACATCGGLLDVILAPPTLDAVRLRLRFRDRIGALRGSGVWRYRELLPAFEESVIASWPEGDTPLLERDSVASWSGIPRLLLKHEGMNPTGSFKDRGMTVGVTQARRIGARAVACASTGNTSAALAAYAALAGIPALVLVPAGQVALGKLTQTLAYGARTLLVRGDFDRCLTLIREASERLGVYLLNSVNPFRIEGQKTTVFELLQQLDWQAPDWIALPAGNLGNTAAYGKALREAQRAGLIDRLPRLLAVQAAGAAPFARSFDGGFERRERVSADTVASAIRIGDPASYARAVRAIRETNGVVLAVTDEEILTAKAVVDSSGIGCEPASAASVAGVRRARQLGSIAPNERVVAVLTGHVLKDPGVLAWYHQQREPAPELGNRPREIEATLQAVEAELTTWDLP